MPATSASNLATVSHWHYRLKQSKLVAHCLVAIAVLLSLPLHKRYMRTLSGWWYRRLLTILNVHVDVHGDLPECTVLAVSNHVSWIDIVVYGSLFQPGFVSKAEVAKWPIVGRIARATNTIFLPRGAFKTQETSDKLATTLERGCSVMLFPEATTSDRACPAPFHARLFAAALDHHYPVQPLAIHYLPENSGTEGHHPWAPWINDAGLGGHLKQLLKLEKLKVSLQVCEVIPADGHDRRSLARASHEAICARLKTPD